MFGTSSGVDVRPVDVRPVDVRPVDVRPADVRPVDVRYGVWDHSSCVWFCLCGPIEATLPTGVWDHRPSDRCLGPAAE